MPRRGVGILIGVLIVLLFSFGLYIYINKRSVQNPQALPYRTIKLVSDNKDYKIQTTNEKFLSSIVEQNHIWAENKVNWFDPSMKRIEKVSPRSLIIHFTNDVNKHSFIFARATLHKGSNKILYSAADSSYDSSTGNFDLFIYINTQYYDQVKGSINSSFSYTLMYALAVITQTSPMEVISNETRPHYFEQRLILPNNSFVQIQKK